MLWNVKIYGPSCARTAHTASGFASTCALSVIRSQTQAGVHFS